MSSEALAHSFLPRKAFRYAHVYLFIYSYSPVTSYRFGAEELNYVMYKT